MLYNWIEDGGAKLIGEALKANASLKELNLGVARHTNITCSVKKKKKKSISNKIGAEGIKSIGESLKANATLMKINLSGKHKSEKKFLIL